MSEYIDKAALVAEINGLIRANELYLSEPETDEVRFQKTGAYSVLNDLLNFLDSLEMKEVDLEEKATQLSQKYFPDEENIWARPNIEAHKCKSACIEMVEWFKAQKGD